MDTFFEHENHAWPQSLAENNEMQHSTSKADLLDSLRPIAPHLHESLAVDVAIFDGATLLHSFDPHKAVKTFQNCCQLVNLPCLKKAAGECKESGHSVASLQTR